MAITDSAKFWDRIAERYSKKPIANEAAYQKKLEITREYFRPDMEVLEFGCGTGSTAIAHAPYVRHLQAIDVSSKMIDIAEDKTESEGIINVTFKCSSIDDFSVPDQTFDAVLGHSVLHLLDNKEEVISRVHKMLRPGGLFVTSTACLGDMRILFRIIAPVGRVLGFFPFVRVFTVKELEDSLTNAGFEVAYQWQPGKNKAVYVVAKKAA